MSLRKILIAAGLAVYYSLGSTRTTRSTLRNGPAIGDVARLVV